MPGPTSSAPATRLAAQATTRPPDGTRRPPLATALVDALSAQIRQGRLGVGTRLPTESALAQAHAVSRTVVREALSRLQASGLVETRHGVGTFVSEAVDASFFQVRPDELATLNDVVAVLELRIAVESEAAALAAERRSSQDLRRMRSALRDFGQAVDAGRDAVAADVALHQAIAQATGNARFERVLAALGQGAIPRARLQGAAVPDTLRLAYLRHVNAEHESIVQAIADGRAEAARMAMRQHLANSCERRRRAMR
jgi:GntR family transcriptional repressor for pyruvate dehydrogenase complex